MKKLQIVLLAVSTTKSSHQLANAAHFSIKRPSDLTSAFALASNYVHASPSTSQQMQRNVFNTNSRKESKNSKSQNQSQSNESQFGNKESRRNKKSKHRQTDLKCNYCGKQNHTEQRCFKKIRDQQNIQESDNAFVETHLFSNYEAEVNVLSAEPLLPDDLIAILPSVESLIEAQATIAVMETDVEPTSDRVLLDTCAQTSVFHNSALLTNIRTSSVTMTVRGINKDATPAVTNQVGNLPGLEKVTIFISPDVKRNILAFDDVEKHYNITYRKNTFIVDDKYVFTKSKKVYATQWALTDTALTTVRENITKFSEREVKQAELARTISQRLAFESDQSLIQAIKHGTILNLPITPKDVINANRIFGSSVASLKGKSTKKSPITPFTQDVDKL